MPNATGALVPVRHRLHSPRPAKAGLHALTQHLVMELAHAKIRVITVSPAVVETPIYQLLSERAAWVSGSVWNVDGGVMAGRNKD